MYVFVQRPFRPTRMRAKCMFLPVFIAGYARSISNIRSASFSGRAAAAKKAYQTMLSECVRVL